MVTTPGTTRVNTVRCDCRPRNFGDPKLVASRAPADCDQADASILRVNRDRAAGAERLARGKRDLQGRDAVADAAGRLALRGDTVQEGRDLRGVGVVEALGETRHGAALES